MGVTLGEERVGLGSGDAGAAVDRPVVGLAQALPSVTVGSAVVGPVLGTKWTSNTK